MAISVAHHPRALVVSVSDEVDPELWHLLAGSLDVVARSGPLIIDLSRITLNLGSGIGSFVERLGTRETSVPCALVVPRLTARRLFRRLGLSQAVGLFLSLEAALAAVAPSADVGPR